MNFFLFNKEKKVWNNVVFIREYNITKYWLDRQLKNRNIVLNRKDNNIASITINK